MNHQDLQINNKFMEYIVALANHRTISAAAESLFISQPAMSHFVSSLEHRLGVKLFNRVRGNYIPTYAGERYLHYATRIMALEAQMSNEFYEIQAAGRGQIRLALPALRSAYILPNLVAAYRQQYPHVRFILYEEHSSRLEQMLLDGKVDFAILNSPAKHRDTASVVIRQDEILLAVPPEHPLAACAVRTEEGKFPSIDLRQFAQDEFILQYPDQRTRRTADYILQEAGITPRVILETRSIDAALRMVGKGLGLCFAPESYVQQTILPHSPVFFSMESSSAIFDLSVAYLKNTYQPAHFRDFVQIAQATL